MSITRKERTDIDRLILGDAGGGGRQRRHAGLGAPGGGHVSAASQAQLVDQHHRGTAAVQHAAQAGAADVRTHQADACARCILRSAAR